MEDNPSGNEEDAEGDGNALDGVYPKPDDMPALIAKSYAFSNNFVELCGWTNNVPLNFSTSISQSTRFRSMVDEEGDISRPVNYQISKCTNLRDMTTRSGSVVDPVLVHVIAKHRVTTVILDKKVFVIPIVIIADETGYGALCALSEGLMTVYNEVDIGDCLLISACSPKKSRNQPHRGLFSESMYLDLELKIQYHSVRSHYLRKLSLEKLSDFKLPSQLFDGSFKIALPSELENEIQEANNPLPYIPDSEKYYDLVGVVSYVGRIERFWLQDAEIQCLEKGNAIVKSVPRYIVYRWICVVDKTSNPILVKVYIGNTGMNVQRELVPGAIVIITHCQTKIDNQFIEPVASMSNFSEICTGIRIQEYLSIHPKDHMLGKIQNIVGRNNYIAIMSRKDIVWTMGGSRTLRIASEVSLRQFYVQYPQKEFLPMIRRESRRIYFSAYILRAVKVDNDGWFSVYYMHKDYSEKYGDKFTKYRVLENELPFEVYKNFNWYSFIRILPPIDPNVFKLATSRNIENEIVEKHMRYCGPLLMPAEVDGINLPRLSELEIYDGPPYFILDMLDEAKMTWYRCIWKPKFYDEQEMCSKINAAKNKNVICLAELFCLEEQVPIEVNLHDFVLS